VDGNKLSVGHGLGRRLTESGEKNASARQSIMRLNDSTKESKSVSGSTFHFYFGVCIILRRFSPAPQPSIFWCIY
jgi:hypothetical protein